MLIHACHWKKRVCPEKISESCYRDLVFPVDPLMIHCRDRMQHKIITGTCNGSSFRKFPEYGPGLFFRFVIADILPFEDPFGNILKTAVINTLHNAEQKGETINVPDMAASLRGRVCDMLVNNTIAAAEELGYKTVAVAGGVSANSELRSRLEQECAKRGIKLYRPELKYCGDNAAMVGVQAFYEFKAGNIAENELNAFATMPIDKIVLK